MLKNLIFILSIACLVTSCSTLRPSTSHSNSSASAGNSSAAGSNIQFINNIAIRPGGQKANGSIETSGLVNNNAGPSVSMEKYSALQFKYAILEDAKVEELNNQKLLGFMEEWYGVPYHYGGMSKNGIDCSAFTYSLMVAVYGISALPRTSKEQYMATKRISRDELQEGDLVFFHTLGRRRAVTHVGVYLRNNKFIHASISGVMISDMNDGYYDKHYIGAGRILNQGAAPLAGAN